LLLLLLMMMRMMMPSLEAQSLYRQCGVFSESLVTSDLTAVFWLPDRAMFAVLSLLQVWVQRRAQGLVELVPAVALEEVMMRSNQMRMEWVSCLKRAHCWRSLGKVVGGGAAVGAARGGCSGMGLGQGGWQVC
jgi:hypothetical protein